MFEMIFIGKRSTSGSGDGFGIFGGGTPGNNGISNYTDKYTYSTNAVAAGSVLGLARFYLAATGNSTVGIFGGGYTGSNSNYTDKYTYASNAVAAGSVLGVAMQALAATGNDTVGIFGGGQSSAGSASNYTDKYTYSSNAVAAGSVLGVARYSLAAASSSPGGF